MSLIEVLISMFVLLFGLMGVAAIFPVGNYYVVEGEKFDLASGIAQNAFEELRARGMLKPEFWHYGSAPPVNATTTGTLHFIQPSTTTVPGTSPGTFNIDLADGGPGHAFVIDPLGNADLNELIFPFQATLPPLTNSNPWFNLTPPLVGIPGELWPVRRLTVLDAGGLMRKTVAETIFRLRDDLAVEQPDKKDVPSIQRWDTVDVDPLTGNPNNTPIDLSDDTLLRRQYKGDYSWLATIVPTTGVGLAALQPASDDFGEISCDVSIVIFRKRVETPSVESERLIQAELLLGGELVIYSTNGTFAKDEVDAAVDDIRSGNWISLMGVNQTTGDFVMKWYRILSLDDETVELPLPSSGSNVWLRRAMLIGPDWPAPTGGATVVTNLRAGILPGVISVVTKPLRMENTSLWNLE